MSDPFADLEALEAHVWERLAAGAADVDDPFRLVALATMGEGGPEARIVALRRADRALGEVEVHSDLRTAKVAALQRDPRAALLLWDAGTQVQLRLALDMLVVAADQGRWARVPEASRPNYGTDPAPGSPIERPENLARRPDIARFGALVGRVRRIDMLSLAHDPHRRAVFEGGSAGWVAP